LEKFEFDYVVEGASAIMAKLYSINRLSEHGSVKKKYVFSLGIASFLLLIFGILSFEAIESKNQLYDYVSYLVLLGALLILMIILHKNLR
jgi:hypothetical protein